MDFTKLRQFIEQKNGHIDEIQTNDESISSSVCASGLWLRDEHDCRWRCGYADKAAYEYWRTLHPDSASALANTSEQNLISPTFINNQHAASGSPILHSNSTPQQSHTKVKYNDVKLTHQSPLYSNMSNSEHTAPYSAHHDEYSVTHQIDNHSAYEKANNTICDTANFQILSFELDMLSRYDVQLVVQSTHRFTELEQQHMEYLIRDVLLRHQLSTEREHHQRWLQSLRQLTGSLRLDELLLTIMDHALEVLPSASAGLFLMHDPISDNMQPRAQRGFHDSIYDYRAQTHEGITGRVFSEGVARVYPTFASIFEDIHNVDEERLGLVAGSFLGDDLTVHGMLAVPVRMHTDKIGVMLIYQFDDSRTLHQGDLDKLQGFADQAAIAIVHARMYSELLDNNRYLERRSQIHRVYTQLSIDNAPLEQIVQTAADMLEFPVCFVDTEAQQTYSAEGYEHIATEQDTSGNTMWTTDDQYAADAASHKISSSNEQIYPVRNGSLLVGYFQLPIQRALEPLEEVILEQASAIVLLHMMNMYSMTGMLYRQSRDFFDELLQHRDPHTLADGLRRYGLHAESPLYVALLQVDSDTTDVRIAENHIRQLIARIDRQPERGAYLLFGSSDKITLLCNTSSASTPSQLAEQLDVIISHWQRDSSIPVYGGIGGAYDGLEQIARSHNEAGRALSYARRRRQTGVMTYADIGINRLFLQQEPQEIENYVQEILSPLRSPKYAAAELEQTLRMYIQENRIAAATAEKLFIHPNTLYVRLRRIEEILQVNLNDSGDWMKVYLACHLSETY